MVAHVVLTFFMHRWSLEWWQRMQREAEDSRGYRIHADQTEAPNESENLENWYSTLFSLGAHAVCQMYVFRSDQMETTRLFNFNSKNLMSRSCFKFTNAFLGDFLSPAARAHFFHVNSSKRCEDKHMCEM